MMLPMIAASFAIIGWAGAPNAENFSGNWPLTVTHSQRSNGTYCLTLNENGSNGSPQGGSASLVKGSDKLPYGTFQVIDHLLVATIQSPAGSQNAGLVFTVPVRDGKIGKGFYEDVDGGTAFDTGVLVFGAKGGC